MHHRSLELNTRRYDEAPNNRLTLEGLNVVTERCKSLEKLDLWGYDDDQTTVDLFVSALSKLPNLHTLDSSYRVQTTIAEQFATRYRHASSVIGI